MEYPKSRRRIDEKVLEKRRTEPCWVCGRMDVDAAHVQSRGSGGPDAEWNVISLCRVHHTEQHKIGWISMWTKYQGLFMRMNFMGWEIKARKLRHPKMDLS